MESIRHIDDIRRALASRPEGSRLGLVATMGNLHPGHDALIAACRERADVTVASVYVNPLLFQSDDDFLTYPRALDADEKRLADLGADVLFAPLDEEMFPDGTTAAFSLRLPEPPEEPGFDRAVRRFEGQGTVWLKLLNMIEPDVIVVGEKDYPQLVFLRRLLREMAIRVEIESVPVERNASGVALSGGLEQLTEEQQRQAPILHQTLRDLAFAITEGARNYTKLEQTARIALRGGGFEAHHVFIRDAETLAPPTPRSTSLRILADAELGLTALSDNLGVTL